MLTSHILLSIILLTPFCPDVPSQGSDLCTQNPSTFHRNLCQKETMLFCGRPARPPLHQLFAPLFGRSVLVRRSSCVICHTCKQAGGQVHVDVALEKAPAPLPLLCSFGPQCTNVHRRWSWVEWPTLSTQGDFVGPGLRYDSSNRSSPRLGGEWLTFITVTAPNTSSGTEKTTLRLMFHFKAFYFHK